MSRSGYSDDCDGWALIRWRGAVASAVKGRRGQAFLRELLSTLDAMSEKRLIRNSFATEGGCCTLGAVAKARGVQLPEFAEDNWDADFRAAAKTALCIPDALAAEIMFWNDELGWGPESESPEARWSRMRKWVADQIRTSSEGAA